MHYELMFTVRKRMFMHHELMFIAYEQTIHVANGLTIVDNVPVADQTNGASLSEELVI